MGDGGEQAKETTGECPGNAVPQRDLSRTQYSLDSSLLFSFELNNTSNADPNLTKMCVACVALALKL